MGLVKTLMKITSCSSDPDLATCCYVNKTNQIQIIRINNSLEQYLERTIFPGQRFIFEASRDSLLEIYTYELATAIVADRIPCEQIAMQSYSQLSSSVLN